MNIFTVAPTQAADTKPVQAASADSGQAANSPDGFAQTLARQQNAQADSPAPGTQPGAAPAADTKTDTKADSPAGAADERADTAEPASSLADMVHELTARSRQVAAQAIDLRSAARAANLASGNQTEAKGMRHGLPAPGQRHIVSDLLSRARIQGAAAPDADAKIGDARHTVRKLVNGDAPEPTEALAEQALLAAIAPPVAAAPAAGAVGQRASAGRDLSTGGLNAGQRLRADAPDTAGLAGNTASISASTQFGQLADALGSGKPADVPNDSLAMLNPVSQAASPIAAATPAAAPLTATIGVPLGAPQWGASFSQQMVQLSSQQGGTIQHAELRLDPPDLGPIRVSISMQGDQASAIFTSPHPAVRAAVEAALPALEQAMADAGISLGNTSVGEQHTPEQSDDGRQGKGSGAGASDNPVVEAGAAVVATRTRGLIDTFA